MIRAGLWRVGLAVAGAAYLWVSGGFSAPWLAYLAVVLGAVYGGVLAVSPGVMGGSPRAWMWRAVVDVALISLLVAATGGASSLFFALYLLSAFEAVNAAGSGEIKILAGLALAGYLAAVAAGTGSLATPLLVAAALQAVTLLLAHYLAGKAGAELLRLREEARQASEDLDSEKRYAERLSLSLSRLGPELSLLAPRDVLQWAAEAARDAAGATYAHASILEGNLHRTAADEDLDSYPGWWHPEVQRLALWSARSSQTLHHDPQIPGIESFVALPLAAEGEDQGYGALLAGGADFGEEEERILSRIAREAALALARREEAPSGRDPVSRLPNHASLRRALQQESIYNGAITLLCAELDGVQRHSQLYGPAATEETLRAIGERLDASQHRAFQTAADEISVLVSGSNESRVRRASLSLKSIVEEATAASAAPFAVYVGIAGVEDGSPFAPEATMRSARRALPEARRDPEGVAHAGSERQGAEQRDISGVIQALVEATEHHDSHLGDHMRGVSRLARRLGERMGISGHRLDSLETGALLHDVGKIGLPQSLLKKPSALSDEEYETMKLHPGFGVEILEPVEELGHVLPLVRHHHERYDGAGYPDGLGGEDIPLEARITLVADALDSMTRERVYQRGLDLQTAVQEITDGSGTQFDPDVVEALLALLENDGRRLRLAT